MVGRSPGSPDRHLRPSGRRRFDAVALHGPRPWTDIGLLLLIPGGVGVAVLDGRDQTRRRAYELLILLIATPFVIPLAATVIKPVFLTRIVQTAAFGFLIVVARIIVRFDSETNAGGSGRSDRDDDPVGNLAVRGRRDTAQRGLEDAGRLCDGEAVCTTSVASDPNGADAWVGLAQSAGSDGIVAWRVRVATRADSGAVIIDCSLDDHTATARTVLSITHSGPAKAR